ncbi:MAG: 4Fe-4S binding protein [Candidatus Bipolaricaulaceae bacterium]
MPWDDGTGPRWGHGRWRGRGCGMGRGRGMGLSAGGGARFASATATIPVVNSTLCRGCKVCTPACPIGAIS